ncbi:MAG: rRNA pseudouridine synthase [Fidelibacterota bacterium]|nr:MAG: rRNA pseudouridine synthase [Candidatus Neomarinimicrobiota bacterium]
MRLNKYLAQAGITSRRKADILITDGRVQVNGRLVTALGTEIQPDDLVEVDGQPVEPEDRRVVYLLHKPEGVLSSVTDPRGRETVVDLIRDKRRLFPIGRLDRDTTGTLLITNDGELANLLTHPRYEVKKVYLAEVKGQLGPRAVNALGEGVVVEGGMRVQASVKRLAGRGNRTLYQITLTEGKNREIKRIFSHFGLPLLRLHRTGFANLSADDLTPGKYRQLHRDEINRLYAIARAQ